MHLRVGPEGNKDEGADSGPVPLHAVAPDEHTLFTELSRPMPDYALEHVFAQHGPIEWVRAFQLSCMQPNDNSASSWLDCLQAGLLSARKSGRIVGVAFLGCPLALPITLSAKGYAPLTLSHNSPR